jgi:PAS domain S-box-containing protein
MLWTQEITRRLMEVIKTGIVVADGQGAILFSNHIASTLCGYIDDRIEGLNLGELFLVEDQAVFFPNILKLVRDGAGFEGEALLKKRDGTVFFVNLSTALYRGDLPDQELIIFTLQDISRLKKIEEDKLESERFAGLGLMADQISHQIRNPIVSIGGFALRLARDKVSRDDYLRYSEIIHSEARRLEQIIDRLAEFAQSRSEKRSPFPLAELFARVSIALEPFVRGNNVAVVIAASESLPTSPLFGDLTRLTTAISSIVVNGIEASAGCAKVSLTARITGATALIEVKDDGEGIQKGDLPFLFDPFFSTRFGHLGLGLTLAKRIVEEHRGEISVHSRISKGTVVVVSLPEDRRRSVRTKALLA